MNTSRCHYCYEEEQREILLVVFNLFAGFPKGFQQKTSHLNGKEWPIEAG